MITFLFLFRCDAMRYHHLTSTTSYAFVPRPVTPFGRRATHPTRSSSSSTHSRLRSLCETPHLIHVRRHNNAHAGAARLPLLACSVSFSPHFFLVWNWLFSTSTHITQNLTRTCYHHQPSNRDTRAVQPATRTSKQEHFAQGGVWRAIGRQRVGNFGKGGPKEKRMTGRDV